MNTFAGILFRLVVAALALAPAAAQTTFITFESGHVRPLALSPDGERLYAVNTPDARLEVFTLDGGLRHHASVPVGLEPVAVAARGNGEVWVVNHLSDSVSIVDGADGEAPRVARTLLVGDEPRDIVFAGADRAFVTTAHRGQHRTHRSLRTTPGAGDPELTTPGVPRADVWVFDAGDPGRALGGTPVAIVELFGDTPRALAVSPDGATVYAAVFHSGNQTTVVPEGAVCDGFDPREPCEILGTRYPGGNPGPATNEEGAQAPETGLIVKYDRASDRWLDELDRDWSAAVRFHLPDHDVFALDASTLETTAVYSHVGTTLFNMAVNPASGSLYVSNTEAINEVRFEGPGRFFPSTVQGHLAEARVTVINGHVAPRHLNKHIDYDERPAPPGVKEHSLATPLDMAVTSDGATLYVAAYGSSKVGVLPTRALEDDTFDPTTASSGYIELTGGGPSGLALDEGRGRLYVLTRFDNSVAAVDLATRRETDRVPLFNPEPPEVVEGRPFLYDAVATSSNGETSCASCHVFGDFDQLAWDLGDPDGKVAGNPIPIKNNPEVTLASAVNGSGEPTDFHPMKGAMTTQSLRGLAFAGAMHWRGDRSVGELGSDPFDPDLSFRNFIVAFEGLVGREARLSETEMQKFTDFALRLAMPPNPVRPLDDSLTRSQERGRDFYFGRVGGAREHRSDGSPAPAVDGFTCNGCHRLDPARGFFGTDREASFEGIPQVFKIPHLRNLYQKVGMFGNPAIEPINPGDNGHQGDQVRGYGFLHDGSIDTLERFFNLVVFNPNQGVGFTGGDRQRRDVEQFMLAYDSDLPPITGQQVTQGRGIRGTEKRLALMIRAARTPYPSKLLGPGATQCDLVVAGTLDGVARGWLYDPARRVFVSDREGETPVGRYRLKMLARRAGAPLTYTCAPFGSGRRVALDRDEDGFFNRDEIDAGTDPADASSHP